MDHRALYSNCGVLEMNKELCDKPYKAEDEGEKWHESFSYLNQLLYSKQTFKKPPGYRNLVYDNTEDSCGSDMTPMISMTLIHPLFPGTLFPLPCARRA